MTKATHTPSAVAQSIVRAGRSYVTAREAAAAASADYRAAAILTCEALRTGVTAKDVSTALVTEVNGDRTLKAEVQTSVAYVTMLARVGRILSLAGDMPRMPARKGEAAKDADVMGPRDVYTLVRRAQQSKGGAAAIDAACETETITSAVDAIRAFIARAERVKTAAATDATPDEATPDEATPDATPDAPPVAPEPDALTLIREAAASVEAAVTVGLTPDALALALALADRLADVLDTFPAEACQTARASLAA
jgi:hypothetical protein